MADIGRSTDPSTATHLTTLPVTSEPASIRYNNPGAQYPSPRAARFGQTGYGIIGGGHKIARFPSPVNGAASNFDLLNRNYVGMAIGRAGTKWTGAHGFGVPGYDPNTILTKQTLDDPKLAIAFLKAIAGRESGKGNNLTEEQWKQAYDMFKAGSATAYLDGKPPEKLPNGGAEKGPTGAGLLRRAREHIGERYDFVLVPKDDPNWKGPWDCAEFISWLVYQEANILYGCIDDNAKPSKAEAYTGGWRDDAKRLGKRVPVDEAASTVGGIVLRYPPSPGAMGHIAVCDGEGGTVEAKGKKFGVVADTVHGRRWDTGVLIRNINYELSDGEVDPVFPAEIYRRNESNMDPAVIRRIQEALASKGFLDRKEIDGEFEQSTEDAVVNFQRSEGLVVDGEVGPDTAGALGISLQRRKESGGNGPGPNGNGPGPDPGIGMNPLIAIAVSLWPEIAKALVGDKVGAIAGIIKKLVTEFAGTDNPDQARQKLKADPDAAAALQLKLAEIANAHDEALRKAQLDLLKEQNQADAKKREADLKEFQARLEDTKGARRTFSELALANNPMAWGAPIVSIIVTGGFLAVLILLITKGMPKQGADTQVAQIINIVVGAMAAAFATVVSFWLGSSQGSRDKSEQIQRQAEQIKETSDAAMELQTESNKTVQSVAAQAKKTETVTIITKPAGEAPKSAKFDRCFEVLLSQVGPSGDPANPAQFGITLQMLQQHLPNKQAEDLKKLNRDEAREFYRSRYWNALNCDKLPIGIDLVVFDFGVDAGLTESATALQEVVGAKVDGSIGPGTLAVTQTRSPGEVVSSMSQRRRDYATKAGKEIGRVIAVEQKAREMIAAAGAAAV